MNNVLLKAFPSKAGQSLLLPRPARPSHRMRRDLLGDGLHSVVLHDDPHHTRASVKKKLLAVVPDMCEPEAQEITNRTHRTGQCIVRTVEAELARAYYEGLREQMLTCTVEPPLS